jgi:hypothetical protein
MKKYNKAVFSIIISAITAGCATGVTKISEKTMTGVLSDKSASYIIFSRPKISGYAVVNNIVEFFPGTEDLVLVAVLRANSKVIYKTTSGEHYFYMGGGENDDMIKINTALGKIYYVHTPISTGLVAARYYFKPVSYKSKILKDNLLNKKCDDSILKKYQFVSDEKEYDYTSSGNYVSDTIGLKIQCRGNSIASTDYLDLGPDSLNKGRLIEISDPKDSYLSELSASYLKEISEDFSEWNEDNYGGNEMTPEDGFPIDEILKI